MDDKQKKSLNKRTWHQRPTWIARVSMRSAAVVYFSIWCEKISQHLKVHSVVGAPPKKLNKLEEHSSREN